MFKFIIPASNKSIALIESKFSDEAVISEKQSANGKYISITVKEVMLDVYPNQVFLGFLKQKGKLGSQHKFPRVMKGKMLEDWLTYLADLKND